MKEHWSSKFKIHLFKWIYIFSKLLLYYMQ